MTQRRATRPNRPPPSPTEPIAIPAPRPSPEDRVRAAMTATEGRCGWQRSGVRCVLVAVDVVHAPNLATGEEPRRDVALCVHHVQHALRMGGLRVR